MKFSIIIPLFNKEAYIGRALRSVLAQSFQDWECIVVDDGSIDRGPKIVESLEDPRIRLVCQENAGPSAARNRGAREASGEWIALLDAGDCWMKCHLSNLAYLIKMYPRCGVVGGNFWGEHSDGRRVLANQHDECTTSSVEKYFEFNAERKGPLVNSSSTAVRKDIWQTAGGFREAFRLAEDADFWARLCLRTDFAVHHSPSSVYFQDQSGASTRTCLYVGDVPFADLAPQIPRNRRWAYNEFLSHSRMVSLALGTLLSGDKVLVRKMAKESLSSSLKKRACLFLAISVLPIKGLRYMYSLYRYLNGLPIPEMLEIRVVSADTTS
jgi:glycosyltransferase involved in cell wall biosynthesis